MVSRVIKISAKTQKIAAQFASLTENQISIPDELENSNEIDKSILINWLKQKQTVYEQERFLFDSLYASVLKDINKSLDTNKTKKADKKSSGWSAQSKFIILAIAGTIFFGCEGFDGITAMLSIASIPAVAIMAAGIFFSLLSIVVFFAFDLVEISKNLGINPKNAPKMVDIYLQEIEMIKSIRRKINSSYTKNNDINNLQSDIELLDALLEKHKSLDDARAAFTRALEKPYLKTVKLVTASIIGIIFFSGGFFAGQTVALAVAGMVGAAALGATAWPILVASIVVGLAALAVYWFVERPGIENLIGRLVGLDREKIEELSDSDIVEKEQNKLLELKDNLVVRRDEFKCRAAEKDKIAQLEVQLQEDVYINPQPMMLSIAKPVASADLDIEPTEIVSNTQGSFQTNSSHSFFKRDVSNESFIKSKQSEGVMPSNNLSDP